MTEWKIKFYHSMPPVLRTFVASVHGYYLFTFRYGRETEALIEENLGHETWDADQWKKWQEEKLVFVLHRAATQVPFYRDLWSQRRRQGDRSTWKYLENWPVLHKETLRTNPLAFIADNYKSRKLWSEHTSGTTGKPLTLWMSKDAVRQWYALFEARWRNWYGLSRHDRWGILGGQMVTPFTQSKPPFWVWNAGMHQLYLSSYHLASQNVAAYMDAIQSHKLVYLLGYASSLYSLAQLALEQKLNIPVLKAVISNAEPLYAHQRDVISRAFQCPVYDTYGLSENVCAASECSEGNLHLWPEVGVSEILQDGEDIPAKEGDVGRLVCTGLLNSAMPLIRYEVGDRAAIVSSSCGCGRAMPILKYIDGRIDDVILTPDGRRIGRLDPVFKADMPIREAQIIQESPNRLHVLCVPATGYSEHSGDALIQRLRERVGDMDIILDEVEAIPRSSNGKFRAVISNLVEITHANQP